MVIGPDSDPAGIFMDSWPMGVGVAASCVGLTAGVDLASWRLRFRAVGSGVLFLAALLWLFGFAGVAFGGAGIDMPGMDCPAAGAASADAATNGADENR